ncbi:MAG: type IV pilus modification protein PilV [Gammaproteobacteria bacterium 39-13]|nr:type IV pilus modification protein PilV [Gammaproteobacteria bacterium]OJV90330.1 MAG: type IV pilus modification protein PilV [Gammaproteobacteria bacterium 39-13]
MNWHTTQHLKRSQTHAQQKTLGFTLLEVLVAIIVFSIGLLGLAGLQILSLKLSGDSLLRTVAALQANDMVDRMRANVAATSLGITSPYNNAAGASNANPACLGMNSSGNLVNTSCTPTQMAQHDFYEWFANLSGSAATSWRPAIPAALPSGAGVVCIDSTPNDGTPDNPACDNVVVVAGKPIFAIKIWWTERQGPQGAGATHRYVTTLSL